MNGEKIAELIDELIDVRIDLISAENDDYYERRRHDLLERVGNIKAAIAKELNQDDNRTISVLD